MSNNNANNFTKGIGVAQVAQRNQSSNNDDITHLTVPENVVVLDELPDDWKKLDGDKKLDKLILKILNSDNTINQKLDNLTIIGDTNTALINEHEIRLNNLTSRVDAHSDKVDNVKLAVANSDPGSEILIDCIPKSLLVTLKSKPELTIKSDDEAFYKIVKDVMLFLEAGSLVVDIMEITEFVKKNPPDTNKFSLKVKFKSSYVRNFVVEKKRKKGDLDLAAIFDDLQDVNLIYINELANKYTHDLYMRARKIKIERNWPGSVWLRNGTVFGRDSIDQRTFVILTKDDLARIR